jgi:hypothetical protein
LLTGHGRLKAHYHSLKIIEGPTCTCGGGSQTADRLLYDCKLYNKGEPCSGDIVTKNGDRWTINKNKLVTEYFGKFRKFISSIDFKSIQPIAVRIQRVFYNSLLALMLKIIYIHCSLS